MPRPKSFNEQELLDKGMLLFWEQGYKNTSLKDLEVCFGLTPPSIYHSFGNKHDLFLSIVDHYISYIVDHRIKQYLNKSSNPLNDLEAFFRSAVGYLIKGKPRFGCLLTNTAIESGNISSDLSQIIYKGFTKLQDALQQELQRAQDLDLLKPNVDTIALASTIFTSYQGLLVMARLQLSDQELQENITHLMRLVK